MTPKQEDRAANFSIGAVLAMSLLLTLLLLLAGCTATPKVVTVTEYKERVVHDTTYQTRYDTRIDSVYVHDTTFVDAAGTVHTNRKESRSQSIHTHDTITQTVEVQVVDSIPYTVEVEKEVPRERSGYDRFCSWFFWIAVVILLLIVGFKICDKIPATKPYTAIIRGLFKWL